MQNILISETDLKAGVQGDFAITVFFAITLKNYKLR